MKRKIASGRADLDPGWYSAMGQGQAMSLLMRAFYRSGNMMLKNQIRIKPSKFVFSHIQLQVSHIISNQH